jgi:hypothetical protein
MRTIAKTVALVAGVVMLAGLAGGQPAAAHFSPVMYSRAANNCGKRVDPIGIIFYGSAATFPNVLAHVEAHTGWDNHSGSRQDFIDHGRCREMDGQVAQPGAIPVVPTSRFHMRLKQAFHHDKLGRWEVYATPHHEDLSKSFTPFHPSHIICHAVDKGSVENPTPQGSGFDQGRRRWTSIIRNKLPHHHHVTKVYWGNTASFKQCDGDSAGSNGWVNWISIPHALGH